MPKPKQSVSFRTKWASELQDRADEHDISLSTMVEIIINRSMKHYFLKRENEVTNNEDDDFID